MQAAKHYVEYDFILRTTKKVDDLFVKMHSWWGVVGGYRERLSLDGEIISDFFFFLLTYSF